MKMRRSKFSCVSSLCAVAASAVLIFSSAGCKPKPEPPEPPVKPVSVNLEFQVFSLPRALAVETVLSQPAGTDYATVLKNVQALVAEKKAALVATPTVTTMSGQRAIVESVLEHKYGTEFSAPQIPQTIGATGAVKKVTKTTIISEETSSFPMTPTTPTAFEKRDLGITLEIEPTVNAKLNEISMQLSLQHVALQGTVKFKTDNNGEIEMPEFYQKRITTNVLVKVGGVAFVGTIEPDKTLSKGEDLTEVIFVRAMLR